MIAAPHARLYTPAARSHHLAQAGESVTLVISFIGSPFDRRPRFNQRMQASIGMETGVEPPHEWRNYSMLT